MEYQTKYEDGHLGNFRRIYPLDGITERYAKFFQHSGSLFQETAAYKARTECARLAYTFIIYSSSEVNVTIGKKKIAEFFYRKFPF